MNKKIALLAHDRMKPELSAFIKERENWLWGKALVATGRTAEFLQQDNFKVPIIHLNPGRSGGYTEITNMVRNGEVQLVLFFRDPNVKEFDHPDIEALTGACLSSNVPLAFNPASAELLILGMIKLESARKTL